jgi:hypothetical protein
MITWSLIVAALGLCATGTLATRHSSRGSHWSPERFWLLGMGALAPAWLIAFLGLTGEPGGPPPNKPFFIVASALPLLGVIVTDAILRRLRATGRGLPPFRSWLLGVTAILPAWAVALLVHITRP